MNILKKLAHTGVSWNDTYTTKRGTLIANSICLILSCCIISIFVVRKLMYGHIPEGITLSYLMLGLFAFLFPLFLNKILFKTAAKIALCYLPTLFLWLIFVSQMLFSDKVVTVNTYDSLRIFLLVVSVVPYLIFDKNDWKMMIVAVLPAVVSFLFFERILSFFGVGYAEMEIVEYGYELMQMRTLAAYIILSAAAFTFQSIIHKNDVYNARFVASLKEQSDEIETQNEELIAIQSQLSDVNNHLEKKVKQRTEELKISNEKLVRQNVQLTEYAFFNSHKLRAPVASILGLIGLLENKNATQEDHKAMIEKIKQSADYLDNVVQEINTILEESKDELG